MKSEDIIRELPKGLLCWYHFQKNSKVLVIGDHTEVYDQLLEERACNVTNISISEIEKAVGSRDDYSQGSVLQSDNQREYDYIIAINSLELCTDQVKVLKYCKELLSAQGRILVGMDNRLGLRYFCGDQDPYTGRNFDGIEHYKKLYSADRKKLKGRTYSRFEIEQFLDQAGWESRRFYSVIPCLDTPQLVYAEDYVPEEDLSIRYFPMYRNPDMVFLEEEYLYTDLINNGMFHNMANSYLIEYSKNGELSNVKHVTISMDRGRENAMTTVIRRDEKVEKRLVYSDNACKLQNLLDNNKDLKLHGISVVEGSIEDGAYVMPYIHAESALLYFKKLIKEDVNQFIAKVDDFRELILQSSEHIAEASSDYRGEKQGEVSGVILKKGYLDLVPLNSFRIGDKFVFIDQEFYEENYPADAIIFRAVNIIYADGTDMNDILPIQFFYERYGLSGNKQLWDEMSWKFTANLRHQKQLVQFNEKHMRNGENINSNRQRMNYSANEYTRLFVNIFEGLENKKLILFGSGLFASKFLEVFNMNDKIVAIIDNNKAKHGTMLEGIPIYSPDYLNTMQTYEYKVIICIKNYVSVLKQLKDMGVANIGIYDTNIVYPRRRELNVSPYVEKLNENKSMQKSEADSAAQDDQIKPKKYHTGYIAGVFDLFHVGHLNMFKRAKEQCDYLIVGVVSDEGVRNKKKTEPFIPFEERIELVRSCRYVDEAVEIPYNYCGTRDAYRLYQFDVQFSGSDYENDPYWLMDKAFLEKNGADMVFFPYTEGTSSTKIKSMIQEKLL